MRRFDYSFLAEERLTARLLNLTSTIYEMRGKDISRKRDYIKIYTELEKVAKVESVKTSNALEGIVTSDERIKRIVSLNDKPLSHSEAEIAGYRDALNFIHEKYEEIDISEETILKLHQYLMAYTTDEKQSGYKKEDNLIIQINEQGERRVRFRPISAKETKKAMQQLILAYQDARTNSEINDLLLIACFIFDFICIHPFIDGNGRISRLLSLLLLYKCGFDIGKYISFESKINANKDYYYDALERSSDGWEDNHNTYIPFVENFLSMLYQCYKELDSRFFTINNEKVSKSARVEATVLNSVIPISKADICNFLPDVSPTTVEAVVGKLVKDGRINKIGTARNTKYYRK